MDREVHFCLVRAGAAGQSLRRVAALLIVGAALLLPAAVSEAALPQPSTIAEAAVLMDAETGRVLYQKNPNKWMHPASTTKIVTLLTAIDKKATAFDQLAAISPKAANTEESELGIRVGDQLPIQSLAEGMMVASGNDAAVALAENVSGSVDAFAADMNAMARKAGARNSVFKNPHGLTQTGHHTTALDLARIASYGMRMPMFRYMVDHDYYTVRYENRAPVTVRTTNLFIRNRYPGANGVKTGYTDAAGDCLVASATRNGRTLVAVFLNDDNRWTDAPAFLNYGFSLLEDQRNDN